MSTDAVSRRQFATRMAAAGAALPLLAMPMPPAQADEKAEPDPPGPLVQPPAMSHLLLEVIKQKYPTGLSAEHEAPILKAIERNLARSRTLSLFPLSNADEPTTTFAAWRADG
jgi:hypothetical protein